MEPYPHHYSVNASARETGNVLLSTDGVPPLETAPPAQFGGAGDLWSPETLLLAAIADCFVLTFRAVARTSKLAWISLRCGAEGRLDRAGGMTRFTQVTVHARLVVPAGSDTESARRILEKAERGCLISNSLLVVPALTCEVETEAAEEHAAYAT